MNNVIENIKSIRTEKGITQQDIASALNTDISVISNIESGKRRLKVDELDKIASALKVSVIDLFTWPKHYVEAAETSKKSMSISKLTQVSAITRPGHKNNK